MDKRVLREYYDDFPVQDTVRDIILDGAKRGGDKRQFIFEDKEGNPHEKSFREVYEDECLLGKFLRSKGVTEGMKVSILCDNCYEWNVLYYTAAVNGNIIVPMDSRLSAEEVAEELIHCQCDVMFFSESVREKAEFLQNHPDNPVRYFFPVKDMELYYAAGREADEKCLADYLAVTVQPDDLCCIVYTSGTTGRTKGVMLTQKNIASDVAASLHAITGGHGIGFLPLNHTYAWVSGLFASLVRSEWGYICTDIRHIYRDIKKYQPYQFAAVPLVVEMIYHGIISRAKRNGSYDKLMSGIQTSRFFMLSGYDNRREMFSEIHESLGGNLEYILCGGAYLDPEIEEFMHDIGIQIITGFGLTECSPCVTCSRRYDYKIGSVGLVLDCNEIKIDSPDENGIGEVLVRGDNVMKGYFNDDEATASVFDGDWLKTGDYGRIDEDGYLFFTGRKKNLIILSNGKNVSPEEIENALHGIEYIKECMVYEEKGHICGAFFLDTETYPDAAERLHSDVKAVNNTLAEYKRIERIVIRDEEFPKTTTLKIKRGAAVNATMGESVKL